MNIPPHPTTSIHRRFDNGDEIDSPPECAILAPVSLGRWGIVFSPQNCPRNERPNRRSKSTEARLGYLVPSAVPSAVPCAAVRPSFRASSYPPFPGLPQLRSLEAPLWSSQSGPRHPSPVSVLSAVPCAVVRPSLCTPSVRPFMGFPETTQFGVVHPQCATSTHCHVGDFSVCVSPNCRWL